tara:strand:- start:1421 stop:2179 length:759 start_codon:yes stop_codon:yes gene_type:complete
MDTNPKATKYFLDEGERLLRSKMTHHTFSGNTDADKLVNNIENYPHAFVIACIMDRQIKAERAWIIPYKLKTRIGDFKFKTLSNLSEDEIKRYMTKPKDLHRYSAIMTHNCFTAIQRIRSQFKGDASNIWKGNLSSAEIVYRFLQFDGIGQKIATMATNILIRDFKVKVSDKYSVDISIDGLVPRVMKRVYGLSKKADSTELIFFARSINPEYPGILDIGAWHIGREWCKPKNPKCTNCPLADTCNFMISSI